MKTWRFREDVGCTLERKKNRIRHNKLNRRKWTLMEMLRKKTLWSINEDNSNALRTPPILTLRGVLKF